MGKPKYTACDIEALDAEGKIIRRLSWRVDTNSQSVESMGEELLKCVPNACRVRYVYEDTL